MAAIAVAFPFPFVLLKKCLALLVRTSRWSPGAPMSQVMLQLLVILCVLAPDSETDSPARAIERLNAALKKADIVEAYDLLAGASRDIDPLILGTRPRFGLGATATARDVAQACQERILEMPPEKRARTPMPQFKVERVSGQGDKRHVLVSLDYDGRTTEVEMLVARVNGVWVIHGVKPKRDHVRVNETMAIGTLKNFNAAQAQFQAVARADVDQNGVGEYGFLGELSGATKVRGVALLNPPVLSKAFHAIKNGRFTRSGYFFRVFLCDQAGKPVREEDGTKNVDARLAELLWCAYAWPVERGKTGKRTFFVNQWGDVHAVDYGGYSGDREPNPTAAFAVEDGTAGTIKGATAGKDKAVDGNTWTRVG